MYERTLSPIRIGDVVIKNRVARAAHATMMARGGKITEELIAYHTARAEGGVGLTILEAAGVHPSSVLSLANLDDGIVEGYRALAAAVAPFGMKVFQQLWHGGHIYPAPDGGPPVAPSSVPSPIAGVAPRPLERTEIREIVDSYAAAARRCEEGGLDGIEVHAGHGYLLAQFLSPFLNQRTDEYGGELENRMRFLVETLRSIRSAVSLPVGVRLSNSADARILSMEDVSRVARRLVDEKLIDYVNVSYGDYYALHWQVAGMDTPTGFQIPHTAPPVAELAIPRLLNGRFRTLEEVEQVLRAGEADIVSMVRAHIADPDIVEKTQRGEPQRVRPCIACNQGCIGRAATFGRLGCTVNAAAGDERRFSERLIKASECPQRILVVGGGPAGMEAARVAAAAGHAVTLAEATQALGGLTNVYRDAPHMQTIGDLRHWLEHEVYRLGVEVRLSTYVEAKDVLAEAPDQVVVAIGADPDLSLAQVQAPTSSVDCASDARIVSSVDFFAARGDCGRSAMVVDEIGHYEAVACAEHLLEQGVAVTYVTRHKLFAPQIDVALRTQSALERLYRRGAFRLRTGAQVLAVRKGEAIIGPQFGGEVETVPADIVVWASIRQGRAELARTLVEKGLNVARIGDALAARNLQTAIREGHFWARALDRAARAISAQVETG